MNKVIVSGATSMLGLALIEKCIKEKIHVIALVNPSSKRSDRIPDNEYVQKLPCILGQIKAACESNSINHCDVFYHFGWAATTHEERLQVEPHIRNISYTMDAVDAAYITGCRLFIGAGSQAEYGRTEEMLSSVTPTFPENPYGAAKLCAGQMSRIKCEQLGIGHIWTRTLSAYGPYDSSTVLLPNLIKALIRKEKFPTTRGEQIWDFIYYDDIANIFYLLGDKGKNGKTYVIGSGEGHPLKEYIEIVKNKIDPQAEIGYGEIPYSSKQVMHIVADISELENDIGYRPDTPFEKGIDRVIEWVKKESSDEILSNDIKQ